LKVLIYLRLLSFFDGGDLNLILGSFVQNIQHEQRKDGVYPIDPICI